MLCCKQGPLEKRPSFELYLCKQPTIQEGDQIGLALDFSFYLKNRTNRAR